MSPPIPELNSNDKLIQESISLFKGEGYLHSIGSSVQAQIDESEVFLIDDFYQFLKKKHSNFDKSDARKILRQFKDDDQTLKYFNRYFFQVLREGFHYIREGDDTTYSINLIDFKDFENNIFRVVDGPVFKAANNDFLGELQDSIDLVVYINGLPLFVWAFNFPNDEVDKVALASARQSIELSQQNITELFKYNAFCVICSGHRGTKYGSSWGNLEDYKEWKQINEVTKPQEENILLATIKGLFCRFRIIEILDNFICFSDTDSSKKIICRYPQYFGATKLLRNIEDKCKKNNFIQEDSGKGGVYFGATGCGKSYTMLFLSKLLIASEHLNRPTILIITDRTSLNYQLGKLFQDYKKYLQCDDIKRIEGGQYELKRAIGSSVSGGIYLTNIQKFKAVNQVLTNRWNFVCISDEAHRTQDSWGTHYEREGESLQYCKGLAQVLHESLPNATYVGFTATPRDKTLDVFGGVIDIYSMMQSVRDGFTVNIDMDHRVTRLKLDDSIAQKIESIYKEMEEQGTSQERIEEDQSRRIKRRKTLSSPQLLKVIAKDIVEHYEERVNEQATFEKALVVVDSREAACTIYKILKELRPAWFESKDTLFPERNMVNVVITNPEEFRDSQVPLLSNKKLADEFRKEKSSFKIAIVCGMWLTGFDVPSLDTMYLNKFLSGPSLIQAISRVNRSYKNKTSGLVVCYVPIKRALEEAKTDLAKIGGAGGICDLEILVEELKEQLRNLEMYFSKYKGWDWHKFFQGNNMDKLLFVRGAVDWLKEQKDQKIALDCLRELRGKYSRCKAYSSPEEEDLSFKDKLLVFEVIWNYWLSPNTIEKIKGKEIDEELKKVFSGHISREEGTYERLDLRFQNVWMNTEIESTPSKENSEEKVKKEEKSNTKNILEENSWLQDKGEKGKLLYEKLKSLVDKHNSSWDAQERMEVEKQIQELKEKEIDALSKEEEEKVKEESFITFIRDKALKQIKEKYKFDYSDEKMKSLAKEIKQTSEEHIQYRDWYVKTTIRSKLKVSWRNLLNRKAWAPEAYLNESGEALYDRKYVVNETLENLLSIFKNFYKDESRETDK